MPDIAKHIVEQKAGNFEPDKCEDWYQTALVGLISQKHAAIYSEGALALRERRRSDGRVAHSDGSVAAEAKAL